MKEETGGVVLARELAVCDLFADLDPATAESIAPLMERGQWKAGEEICREGEKDFSLYVVLRGRVEVVKRTNREGEGEKRLAVLEEGSFFGEMALVDEEPRSATVRALEPTVTARLERRNFLALLGESGIAAARLLLTILSTVNERLRRTNTELVLLYETGRTMSAGGELESRCRRMLEAVCEHLDFDAGYCFALEPGSTRIVLAASTLPAGEQAAAWTAPAEGTGGGVTMEILFGKKRPFLFNRFPQEKMMHGFESRKMLGVPLVVHDECVGALVFTRGGAGDIARKEMHMVQAVAAQCAGAVAYGMSMAEKNALQKHRRVFITFS